MSYSDINDWNSLALKYWQHRSTKQKWAHEYVLFPEFLRLLNGISNFTLLDFGCGDGSLLYYLFNNNSNVLYYGYDKSSALMQIAKNKHPNFNYIYELCDNKFDVICMNMVLQDVLEPTTLLNELGKTLNNNGVIIFSIPHPVFSLIESHHLTTKRIIKNIGGYHDIYRYKSEETEQVIWNIDCTTSTNLYNRTLATYSKAIKQAGYKIIEITEPMPVYDGKCDMELYQVYNNIPKFMFFVIHKY